MTAFKWTALKWSGNWTRLPLEHPARDGYLPIRRDKYKITDCFTREQRSALFAGRHANKKQQNVHILPAGTPAGVEVAGGHFSTNFNAESKIEWKSGLYSNQF